jgi:hypothetical protein
VRHIKNVSRTKPALAADWQDFICEVNGIVAGVIGIAIPVLEAMLQFFEGFVGYIDEKCQPVPPPVD